MSKFLAYVRNDKGGAVEYVLIIGLVGGMLVAALNSNTLKTTVNSMFSNIFTNANSRTSF